MKHTLVTTCSLAILLLGGVGLAQMPTGEIDSHIAIAKTAAGQDYRGTFVNLCLPAGAPAGGGRGAAAGRGAGGAAGRGAGGGAAARGTPAAPQTPDRNGWYAPPYKIFDNLYWLG